MDIDLRTKLVLALVTVALGSMLALAFASYPRARDLLQESALRTLDGVAESKASNLEYLTRSWRAGVNLIASRTQLRLSAATYSDSHDPAERDRIERILTDARLAVPAVRTVAAWDADGHEIATSGPRLAPEPPLSITMDTLRSVAYAGLQQARGDSVNAVFTAPLLSEGRRVGTLAVVIAAGDMLGIATDLTGLGESGEIVIAERISADSAIIINSRRHSAGPPLSLRVGLDRADDPVTIAMTGLDTAPHTDAVDYRGETVWAATRFLPDMGWGLVVKFDAVEQQAPIGDLRDYTIRLALALSAFAILIGTILALSLARPIRHLADVADRILAGDLDARANEKSNDEIGVLARTFNQMAAKLIETNRELARKVERNGLEGGAAPHRVAPDGAESADSDESKAQPGSP